MKVFKIYKITNLINNKCYVGQTYRTVEQRFKKHCKLDERFFRPLTNAILKYGKENFKLELLAKCYEQSSANDIETFYIRHFNSMKRDFGYNLVEEGNGERNFSENSLRLMREARIKSYNSFSQEKKEKIKQKLRLHFQGLKKNKKTGFIGVFLTKYGTFNIKSKIWKNVKRQSFNSPVKAAICYDKLVLFLLGEEYRFNFPGKIEKWKKQNLEKFFEFMCKPRKPQKNIRNKFIFFSRGRWVVCFYKNKKKLKSKTFSTQLEAEAWRDANFDLYMNGNS